MRTGWIAPFAPFALFVVFALAGCSGGGIELGPSTSEQVGVDGGEVTAPDGSVTLIVPAGALATQKEITIKKVTAPSDVPGTSVVVAYELGPVGTTFDLPITVRWILGPPNADGHHTLPILTTVSEDGVRIQLDDPVVDIAEDGTATASGQLTKLARLEGLSANDISFSLDFDAGTTALLGESIPGFLFFSIEDALLVDSATLRPTWTPVTGYAFPGADPIAVAQPFGGPVLEDIEFRCEQINNGKIGVVAELAGEALAQLNPPGALFQQPFLRWTASCREPVARARREAAAATRMMVLHAVDRTGAPIGEADVLVESPSGATVETVTDADGLGFVFAGPDGAVDVTIRKDEGDGTISRISRQVIVPFVGVVVVPGLVLRAPDDSATMERDGAGAVTVEHTLTDGDASVSFPVGAKVQDGGTSPVTLELTAREPWEGRRPAPGTAHVVQLEIAAEQPATFLRPNGAAGVDLRMAAAAVTGGITPHVFLWTATFGWLDRGAGVRDGDDWLFTGAAIGTHEYAVGWFVNGDDVTLTIVDQNNVPIPDLIVLLDNGAGALTDIAGRVTFETPGGVQRVTMFTPFIGNAFEIEIDGSGDLGVREVPIARNRSIAAILTMFDGEIAAAATATITADGASTQLHSNDDGYAAGLTPAGQGDITFMGEPFIFDSAPNSVNFYAAQAFPPRADGAETTFQVVAKLDYSRAPLTGASGAHVQYTDGSGTQRMGYLNKSGRLTIPRPDGPIDIGFQFKFQRSGIGQVLTRFFHQVPPAEQVGCVFTAAPPPPAGGDFEISITGSYTPLMEGPTELRSVIPASSGITRLIPHTDGAFNIAGVDGENNLVGLTFGIEGIGPQKPLGFRRTLSVAFAALAAGETDAGALNEMVLDRPLRLNFDGAVAGVSADQIWRPRVDGARQSLLALPLGEPQQAWDVNLLDYEGASLSIVVRQEDAFGKLRYLGTYGTVDAALRIRNAEQRPRVTRVGNDGVDLTNLVVGQVYRIEQGDIEGVFRASATTQFVPTPTAFQRAFTIVSCVRLDQDISIMQTPSFARNAIGAIDEALAYYAIEEISGERVPAAQRDTFGRFPACEVEADATPINMEITYE